MTFPNGYITIPFSKGDTGSLSTTSLNIPAGSTIRNIQIMGIDTTGTVLTNGQIGGIKCGNTYLARAYTTYEITPHSWPMNYYCNTVPYSENAGSFGFYDYQVRGTITYSNTTTMKEADFSTSEVIIYYGIVFLILYTFVIVFKMIRNKL